MTDTHYCPDFDLELKNCLPHLVRYPQLLPFIGRNWNLTEHRIIFIAESHYLPENSEAQNKSETWYNSYSSDLSPKDRSNINTRSVVEYADNYVFNKTNFHKSHSIFYNLKAAIFSAWDVNDNKRTVYEHVGYYNYFQRPAEITGKSINNTAVDNKIAYTTLSVLCNVIKPTAIVFVSSRAYSSFQSQHQQGGDNLEKIPVYHVPHPSCPWWNRRSKRYGQMSGRERLIAIIRKHSNRSH